MSLNTLQTGSGKPVVLIHGFCEDLSIWTRLQNKLSQWYKVISIDLPGFGKSKPLDTDFTISDVADSVFNHIRSIESEPFAVIGHSLGGYVALALAEAYYNDLTGLGLFHSTSYSDADEKKQNREKAISFIIENGSGPFIKTFVPGLFYPPNIESQEETISQLISSGLKIDSDVIIAYTKAMRDRPDRSSILFNFGKPRLFIGGEKDVAVSYKDILAQINHLQGETTAIFEHTGHMGMYEQPAESYHLMKQFLSKVYS